MNVSTLTESGQDVQYKENRVTDKENKVVTTSRGYRYGTQVSYTYLSDLKLWEAKGVLTQQYLDADAEEFGEELKLEVSLTEETLEAATIALNTEIIDLFDLCEGDFRNLPTEPEELESMVN
jgi:hypothetical protein